MLICRDQRNGIGCGAENPNDAERCYNCGRSLRYGLYLHDSGTIVGRYRIERMIGHGGFGAVYEAVLVHKPHIHIALKESLEPDSHSAFSNEFTTLKQLRHDHLPRYHEVFEEEGHSYLVMEFIPGQSLEDIIEKQDGPLSEAQVLGYALQVCTVLTYLHSQKPSVIHRDIKPANIRLTPEGLVKLVDFGLYKIGTNTTHNSRRGFTPDYSPPEQWDTSGQYTDIRSDIYSLGATLYHLFTGERPPAAGIRMASGEDPMLSPLELNERLSENIAFALRVALALQREQRFATIEQFRQSLLGLPPTYQLARTPTQPLPPVPAPPIQIDELLAPSQDMRSPPDVGSNPTVSDIQAAISTIAWSPDGMIIAAGSVDTRVRLWQVDDGQQLHTFRGHTGQVHIAWNPDGTLLASGSRTTVVRLWDVDTGRMLRAFQHVSYILGLVWSPDGQTLATLSGDLKIYLWSITDGSLRHTYALRQHTGIVSSVAWSPDGTLLASGSNNGTIQLWSVQSGVLRQANTLRGHHGPILSLAWSPDNRYIASGSRDGTVRLWRVSGGVQTHILEGHERDVTSVAWHPDGVMLASGGWDKTVHVWRGTDGSLLEVIEDNEEVYSVAWHPEEDILAIGSKSQGVLLWGIDYT